MIAVLCGLLAAVIVVVVVLAALMGWGEQVTRCQRYGLCIMASGLILAAPSRYSQGIGLADLMFLAGIAVALVSRHWRGILKRADCLDGVEDGRVRLSSLARARIERVSRAGSERR